MLVAELSYRHQGLVLVVVFCVMFGDVEGETLSSIWSTQVMADEECERMNVAHNCKHKNYGYYVDEYTVDPVRPVV